MSCILICRTTSLPRNIRKSFRDAILTLALSSTGSSACAGNRITSSALPGRVITTVPNAIDGEADELGETEALWLRLALVDLDGDALGLLEDEGDRLAEADLEGLTDTLDDGLREALGLRLHD